MKTYLRYYFSFAENKLNLGSVACVEGEEPQLPKDFLKWYEYGDIDFARFMLTSAQKAAIPLADSPIFLASSLLHNSSSLRRSITFNINRFRAAEHIKK
ncbi:MAG: hypothetical protein M0R50_11205 [Candidatus Cloacimonetes bacterium]|jgi:hypothetical protein|nr:hypothetical protein [Candidatus Cloacimonadota bacterium]